MKSKIRKIKQRVLSLICATTVLITGLSCYETVNGNNARNNDPWDGYTRITMDNYGIVASTEEAGTTYTSAVSGTYTGTSLNHTYLDVDVNFNGTFGPNNYFHYFGSGDWENNIRFWPYDDGTGIRINDVGGRYETLTAENVDTGIAADEFFNVKVLTDIVANANDATKVDVTLQYYLNNNYIGTMTWTENAGQNHNNFYFWLASGSCALRTPVVEEPGNPWDTYTRLTMESYGIVAATEEAGTTYTAPVSGMYTGTSLNKTYLDVDVNFNGTVGTSGAINYFHYFGSSDWDNNIRFIPYNTGISIKDVVGRYAPDPWIASSDYDIVADEFFNVKILADIVASATDATKEDVTLRIYFNEILAATMTWTEDAGQNHNNFYFWIQSGSCTLRTPIVEEGEGGEEGEGSEAPGDPWEEYTRITMENYGIVATTEEAGTTYTAPVTGTYTGTSLDKTYLDVDINFNGTFDASNYFHYFGSSDWEENIRFIPYDTGMSIKDVAGRHTPDLWTTHADYDIASDEFFNVKILTDIAENANDATKEGVVLRIYFNESLAGSMTWTEDEGQNHNNFYFYLASGSCALRTPVVEESEEGGGSGEGEGGGSEETGDPWEDYTMITMMNYGIAASTEEAGTTYTGPVSGTYTGTSLDKTYLDVDVNFNGTFNASNYFHYFGSSDWDNNIRFAPYDTGMSIQDVAGRHTPDLWTTHADYDIVADEFFNVKILTDIVENANDATKEDVTIRIYFNENFAGTMSWTEDAGQNHNNFYFWVASGSISLRSAVAGDAPEDVAPSEALADYKRVTTNDFGMIDEVFTHGWNELNWMGYEYPESLNHTYLDADVALCDDESFQNSIRYLSSNGWESLQIGIAGDTLKVYETSTGKFIYSVSISQLGISADTYFNMKLSTDISVNESDSSKKDVTLGLWIENKLVRSVYGEQFPVIEGCTMVGSVLGVYVPNPGTIRMKSTKSGEGSGQRPSSTEQPNENFRKITFGNFNMVDGTYTEAGPMLGENGLGTNGRYILSLNETVFSGNFHFSKIQGGDFRFGGKKNPWNGLIFWTTGDGKLYMQDAVDTVLGKGEAFAFHPMYAGVQLVDNTFNMKISTEFVDSDGDGAKDDVKLGVWFNDVLYRNDYIYLLNYASKMGSDCSVYVRPSKGSITISSDKSVYTGVDFTLFGFTNNWKKEVGIK